MYLVMPADLFEQVAMLAHANERKISGEVRRALRAHVEREHPREAPAPQVAVVEH
jgi:hypothetical protein